MSKPSEAPATVGYRYKFEGVEFDETAALLQVDGQAVSLEPRPMRLLAELLHHLNEVVTRDELFESVWDGRPTVDGVLANAVNKLRKALGEPAAARVVTVPRVGYRFVGPVERVAELLAPEALPDLQAGQAVPGREGWRLERPLGAGTRGHVWLARQAKIGTLRVFKFAADADSLRALKREYTLCRVLREELGERDDFAQLVDCNFAAPPFFIECEYGGEDLAAWAGEHLAGLDLGQRLALFLQVAQAVAAAHRVGVLHKDLKPANILVSPDPARGWRARLIDFGSGRALDLERLRELQLSMQGLTLTQHLSSDALTGTPLYLAPELLAGEAPSMQSDLYALGLILFQLLVGDLRRPLATGWQRDVADPLLQQDIAAATEGHPEDRPASVQAWVEQLCALEERRARIAVQQAKEAELASLHAAAQRHQARRPWLLATFASLLLGLAGSAGFAWQANRARAVAVAEAARAQAINDFILHDFLQAADITGVGPNKTFRVEDMLRRASQKVHHRFETLPATEAEIRVQLGELHYRAYAFKAATQEFDTAIRLLAEVAPQAARTRIAARYGRALALSGLGKLDEAESELQLADQELPHIMPDEQPRLKLRAAQAKLIYLNLRTRYPQALAEARTAVVLADQQFPNDLGMRFAARISLVEMQFRSGELDEAQKNLNEIMTEPFTPEAIGEVRFARAQVQISRLQYAQNQATGGAAALLKARDAIIGRLGKNEYSLGLVSEELGRVYSMLGKFDLAEQAYREAHRVYRFNFGDEHVNTRGASLNIALLGMNMGHSATALRQLDADRPWFVGVAKSERGPHVQLIDFYRLRCLLDVNAGALAAEIFPKLDIALLNQASPSSDWDATMRAEQGRLLMLTGQAAKGRSMLQTALQELIAANADPWDLNRYRQALDGVKGGRTRS